MSSERSEPTRLTIPIEGVLLLARYWAGAGSLVDWAAAHGWDIHPDWDAETTRARFAYALLLYLEQSVFRFLPSHTAAWLDLVEQEMGQTLEWTDYPDAHTDWAVTLSEYGGYPPPVYVNRLHYSTFDTPLTRSLLWLCRAVRSAENIVWRRLGQRPVSESSRASLEVALGIPAVQGATEVSEPDSDDLAACRTRGGVWALIGIAVTSLRALWSSNPGWQLLGLAPILPTHQEALYELGCVGIAASAVREAYPDAPWSTRTPLAAATSGLPCLVMRAGETVWSSCYQTVPTEARGDNRPYATLAEGLGGGMLRPDLWVILDGPAGVIELVVECKCSVDPSYLRDGIIQLLAYSQEYPVRPDLRRVHLLVCPEEVVGEARSWEGAFAIGNPRHLRELVSASLQAKLDLVLRGWTR